jgi:hypothetical protein
MVPSASIASAGVDLRKGMKVFVTHPLCTKGRTRHSMTAMHEIADKAAKAPMDSKTDEPLMSTS